MSRFLVIASMSHNDNTRMVLGVVAPGTRADAETVAYERFRMQGHSPVDMFSLAVPEFAEGTDIINAMS